MACITKRRKRWVADFYDQHGKRRWKTMPEGSTKKQARDELRAIEEQVSMGSYILTRKMPDFSKVADMWLALKKPNIRHSTYDQYKGHVENHLKPFFGRNKITRINYDAVENFIAHSIEEKVSVPTLRKIQPGGNNDLCMQETVY